MKASDVHKMGEDEMAEELDRLRKRLFELRSQSVTEKLENPRQLRHIRRDIARIQTEQRERELRQQQQQQESTR